MSLIMLPFVSAGLLYNNSFFFSSHDLCISSRSFYLSFGCPSSQHCLVFLVLHLLFLSAFISVLLSLYAFHPSSRLLPPSFPPCISCRRLAGMRESHMALWRELYGWRCYCLLILRGARKQKMISLFLLFMGFSHDASKICNIAPYLFMCVRISLGFLWTLGLSMNFVVIFSVICVCDMLTEH